MQSILSNKKSIGIFSFLFLFQSANVLAQSKLSSDTNYQILSSSGSFTPNTINSATLKDLNNAPTFEGKRFVLVQFYELPTYEQRKQWEEQGFKLMDYFPNNAYFASVTAQFPIISIQNKVRVVQLVDAKMKMATSLYTNGIPEYAKVEGSYADVTLSYYAGLNYSNIKADLEVNKIKVRSHEDYARQIHASIPVNDLEKITALPYIQFIEAKSQDPIPEAYEYNNTTGRSNYLNTGFGGRNYNGEGVTITIDEGGSVDNIIDLKGRLIELMGNVPPTTHKIGVVRQAANAGNTDPSNRNNAWGAQVVSANDKQYVNHYNNYKSLYTNHSYGWAVEGGYNTETRNHDLRYENYPELAVVYSSGNSGTAVGFPPYQFSKWSNITGAPKQSKNQYTIGSLNPTDDLMDASSRGPYYDGRIAPQLVIEGTAGTSYAAPKVTGLLAILAQIYKEKHNNAVPHSTLLKGILMNTADDLYNPGPDFKTGYGKPNMRRAYHVLNNNQFLSGSILNTNEINNHTIHVPANTKQLRVMIVWADKAAAVNAARGLVNDINLKGTSPSNQTFNPWVLNVGVDTLLLKAPAVRGIDSLNPMEQITVDNPVQGNWTFSVSGYNVPSGPQSYFLVYEFVNESLEIAYPLENEKFIPGEIYRLRWDSYGITGNFDIEYALDNTNNWITIATNIDAEKRVWQWIVPMSLNQGIKNIRFRVKQGGLVSTSGINQVGAIPEYFNINKACSSTVTLSWAPVPGATGYRVYRLGQKIMEPVTSNITFNGTSAVLTGQSTSEKEYYAIAALTGTIEGSKTIALEKNIDDYYCLGYNWTGTVSDDWFTADNWADKRVPTDIDNVVIPANTLYSPIINQNGAICGRLLINSGATLTMHNVNPSDISVHGTWENNGTFNRGIGVVNFEGTNLYQEIKGTSNTAFNELKVNLQNVNNVLDVTSVISLHKTSNPFQITAGTIRFSSASTLTLFHTASIANIGGSVKIINNGANINYGNVSFSLNKGTFINNAGTTTFGNAATLSNIIYYSSNGKLIINGGTVNINGRFNPSNSTASGELKLQGGELIINNNNSRALNMTANSTLNLYSGKIIFVKSVSTSSHDVSLESNNYRIEDGIIQFGNSSTPAGQLFRFSSAIPLGKVIVNNPSLSIIDKNLTIAKDFEFYGSNLITNEYNVELLGNLYNTGIFQASNSKISFKGNAPQIINSTNSLTLDSVEVNNANGVNITQNNTIQINKHLNLVSGILSTPNMIIINEKVIVDGNDNNRFIDGKVRKIGNEAFTFPIGKNGIYAPISITAPSLTTDHFTAAYYPNSNPSYPVAAKTAPLVSISDAEYWMLDRTNGNSNVAVTLSWNNSRSGLVTNDISTQVARWNGSSWVSAGRANATNTATSGTIRSNPISSFSPFTFGSTSAPLPIDFVYFNAKVDNDKVDLAWKIGSVDQLHSFDVEKSTDGTSWQTIETITQGGQEFAKNEFAAVDENLQKEHTLYYRIKLLTKSNDFVYSKIAKVTQIEANVFKLYPNPANNVLYVYTKEKEYAVSIYDLMGKKKMEFTNQDLLDINSLESGNYIVVFTTANKTYRQTVSIVR